MSSRGSWIVPALLLMACAPAVAEEPIFYLECAWEYTLDAETAADKGPTSGSKTFTVDTRRSVVKKEGLGAEFTAKISDAQIYGEMAYQIAGQTYRERITINRFSGRIENWWLLGKGGLVHYGRCAKVTRQF